MIEDLIQLYGCPRLHAPQSKDCAQTVADTFQQWVSSFGYTGFHFACGRQWGHDEIFYSSVLSSFSSEWMELYFADKFYRIDPVYRWIKDHSVVSGAQYNTWQSAYKEALAAPLGSSPAKQTTYIKKVNRMVRLSAEHGMKDGLFITFDTKETCMQLSLSSTTRVSTEIDPGFIKTLINGMQLLVLALGQMEGCATCSRLKIAKHDQLDEIKLTPSQKRVLKLFLDNPVACTEEIARLYGATAATINHHLGLIRVKLDKPHTSGHVLATFAQFNQLF